MKAYLLVTVSNGKAMEVIEDIVSVVKVNTIMHVTGVYDIIVEIEDTYKSQITEMTAKVRKIHNVRTILGLFDVENNV